MRIVQAGVETRARKYDAHSKSLAGSKCYAYLGSVDRPLVVLQDPFIVGVCGAARNATCKLKPADVTRSRGSADIIGSPLSQLAQHYIVH